MKKILITIVLLFSIQAFAQTDGINYQAVIIGPDNQELPGVDAEGNILPDATIALRFTIIDANNQLEYQEILTTNTDQYGRINVLIGQVNPDAFAQIRWDGTKKDLKVDIDFKGGNSFMDMSREELTFLPYAYHRNITAAGTLTVDDKTYLNSELTVQGPTQLNSTLDVNNNNKSNLTGALNVDGKTVLQDTLTVLNEAPALLTGDLTVEGEANFADIKTDYLIVDKTSHLNDQVTITIDPDDTALTDPLNDDNFGAYALQVITRSQGIAVKVEGSRSNHTNFISFWDTTGEGEGTMWGRIEGEKWIDKDNDGELDDDEGEFVNDNDFNDDIKGLDYDILDAENDFKFQTYDGIKESIDLVSSLYDLRTCIGAVPCITAPSKWKIAANLSMVLVEAYKEYVVWDVRNRARENKSNDDSLAFGYLQKRKLYQGVTYQSGAGDYAEYLLRDNINETMGYGDIVGVRGGKISKNTIGAERMMVISRKPIVLGNMPQPNKEQDYEKVAFMGQVLVKVFGKVNIGDYILPSGKNDGVGIAISPSQMSIEQIKKIVGIAWSEADNVFGFNLVNVAVGLNTNDNNPIIEKLEKQVKEQAVVINTLKEQFEMLIRRMDNLESGVSVASKSESEFHEDIPKIGEVDGRKYEIEETQMGEIVYWEIKREDFENGLELAEKTLLDEGLDFENNEFWRQIKTNPEFKNSFFNTIKSKVEKQLQYHKEINKGQ